MQVLSAGMIHMLMFTVCFALCKSLNMHFELEITEYEGDQNVFVSYTLVYLNTFQTTEFMLIL